MQKSFEEAFRIQTAFMHSQLNALGKQATSFGEDVCQSGDRCGQATVQEFA